MKALRSLAVGLFIASTVAFAQGDSVTQPLARFECGNVEALALSPDGSMFVTSGRSGAFLWQLPSGTYVRSYEGHTDWVLAVAISADSRRVLTGSTDETARLWELATGKLVRTFTHADWVEAVAISRDGSRILTAVGDTAKLWNASTGNLIRTFTGHLSPVRSVAFSPDGQYVLTGSWDNTAKLWSIGSSSALRTFVGHTSFVNSVAFSPDGSNVLTGSSDDTARLWETATGKLVRKFEDPFNMDMVQCAAFSPKGDRVFCGSWGVGSLWTTSGLLLREFYDEEVSTMNVHSAAFLPNGEQILLGYESTATLWDLSDLIPNLSIGLPNGFPEVRWSGGLLQEAASVNGTWSDLTSVTSPYRITSPGRMKFFRLKL